MTYPPTTPGFPAPQRPGGSSPQPGGYGPPAYPGPAAPAGPSKLPVYLTAAVAVLGLAAYLASFGPLLSINTDIGPFGGAEFTASGLSYWTVAALLAGLLAAVSLLPRAKSYTAIIAVTAVLAVLLVIGQIINRPSGFSVGWALWLVLLCTLLQAATAVAALLYESGVLSAPAPRPRPEAQPYGQYGPPPGGYYGAPGAPGAPGQQGQPQPGYPTPYGTYTPGGSGGSAGYGSQTGQADDTNTPPSGFSGYTPPSTTGYSQPAPAAEPAPGTTPGAESSSPGPTPS